MNHFDNSFLTYAVIIRDQFTQPGYTYLFMLSFLAATLLPLGSEWLLVMMLIKGYPPLATVICATTGNCLGALTTYLIGICGGTWLITRVLRISPEQQLRACNHYRRYGIYSLLFTWLPIIGDPLCLVSGMMRTGIWTFTLMVASGKLFRYAVAAWITLRISG